MSDNPLPGNPAAVAALADQIGMLGRSLDHVGTALRSVDTGAWNGQAAEAFHAHYLNDAPKDWWAAGDAMQSVSNALRTYADELARQQQRAAHAAAAKAAALQAGNTPPGGTPPADDPALSQAIAELAAAANAVQQAGDIAAQQVKANTDLAPAASRHFWDDRVDAVRGALTGLSGGVADAVKGTAQAAWGLGHLVYDNVDPAQRLLHPGQAQAEDTRVASALGQMVTHPAQTISTIADLPTWQTDPERALGKLLPSFVPVGGVVGGVTGKIVGTGTRVVEDAGDTGRVAHAFEEAPKQPPTEPALPHDDPSPASPHPDQQPTSPPGEGVDPNPQPDHHEPPWHQPPPPPSAQALEDFQRLQSSQKEIESALDYAKRKAAEPDLPPEMQAARDAEVRQLFNQRLQINRQGTELADQLGETW